MPLDTLAKYRDALRTISDLERAVAHVERGEMIVFWKDRGVMAVPTETIDVKALLEFGRDGWRCCYSRNEALARLQQQMSWAMAPWN